MTAKTNLTYDKVVGDIFCL